MEFLRIAATYNLPTYAAGHKLLVRDRLKAGLGKGVLQRELFRLRHRVRPDEAVASFAGHVGQYEDNCK